MRNFGYHPLLCCAVAWISCVASIAGAAPKSGTSWLVVTQTQTVSRHPGSMYLHVIDPDRNSPQITLPLSGYELAKPVSIQPDGLHAQVYSRLASSPGRGSFPSSLSVYSLSPFTGVAVPLVDHDTERIYAIPAAGDREGAGLKFVTLGTGDYGGYVSFDNTDASNFITLDGEPVDALRLHGGSRLALLVRRSSTGSYALQLLDPNSAAERTSAQDLPVQEDGIRYYPVTLAADDAGRFVYVLAEGETPSGSDSAPSFLFVFDVNDRRWLPGIVPLQGRAVSRDTPLVVAPDGSCYVLLRDIARGFGYVYRVSVEENVPKKTTELSFAGIQHPIRAVTGPDADRLTLGINRRVQHYSAGQVRGAALEFDAPISALSRAETSLAIGEGRRLHILIDGDTTGMTTIPFQYGRVVGITPSPALADTAAAVPEVWPSLPPVVRIPTRRFGEYRFTLWVGRGLDTCAISGSVPELNDRLNYTHRRDADGDHWLTITYRFSTGGERRRASGGGITVQRTRSDADGRVVKNFSTIRLEVPSPEIHSDTPQVLWVTSASDADTSFANVRNILRQPPHPAIEHTLADAFHPDWLSYDVVVVSASAASLGVLSRQQLIDYVTHGGVVVWMGEALPDAKFQRVARWLEPLGMQILPFDTAPLRPVSLRLDAGFRVPGHRSVPAGNLVRTAEQHNVLVASPEKGDLGLVAYRDYGLGRFVYLSSPEWLDDAMVDDAEGLRFIRHFFHWLIAARRDTVDSDGDGLSDLAEDRNGNGAADPGETDFRRYDTDNDGLSDGIEDANLNGRTDPGETSPLNPDTNQNGILDGSDEQPLPSTGSPYIQRIHPQSAPAEGGESVVIEGRNFRADTRVYFGATPSPQVTQVSAENIIAIVPSGDASLVEKNLDVRVASPAYETEGTLEKAFTYAPPSRVDLMLTSLAFTVEQYGIYAGRTAVRLRPGFARIGRVELELHVEPSLSIAAFDVKPGKRAGQARRKLRSYQLAPGRYRIELSDGPPMMLDLPIFTFRWGADCRALPARAVTWKIVSPDVRERFGGRYDPDADAISYNIGKPPL
jgi:IPT/TIG domain